MVISWIVFLHSRDPSVDGRLEFCLWQSSFLVVHLNFIHREKDKTFLEKWSNGYIFYKNFDVLKWCSCLKSAIFLHSFSFIERPLGSD